MEYPQFKYIENAKDVLEFSDTPIKCNCCGKETNIFTKAIYTKQNVNAICADCVKSGFACEKLDGCFNEVPEIGNEEAEIELSTKTPQLPTFQEIEWPSCCGDFCKFLRACTDKDLKNSKIVKDLEETFEDDFFEFDEIFNLNPYNLLLFKCNKCSKHYIKIDLD